MKQTDDKLQAEQKIRSRILHVARVIHDIAIRADTATEATNQIQNYFRTVGGVDYDFLIASCGSVLGMDVLFEIDGITIHINRGAAPGGYRAMRGHWCDYEVTMPCVLSMEAGYAIERWGRTKWLELAKLVSKQHRTNKTL